MDFWKFMGFVIANIYNGTFCTFGDCSSISVQKTKYFASRKKQFANLRGVCHKSKNVRKFSAKFAYR